MPCVDKKGNLKGKIEAMLNTKQTWQTWLSSTCKHLMYGANYKSIRCQSCSKLKEVCAMYYTNQIQRLQLIRTKVKRTNNQSALVVLTGNYYPMKRK